MEAERAAGTVHLESTLQKEASESHLAGHTMLRKLLRLPPEASTLRGLPQPVPSPLCVLAAGFHQGGLAQPGDSVYLERAECFLQKGNERDGQLGLQ